MASLKGKIAKELAERLKAGDELAMDFASRMQRAADQGFDTSNKLFHGTAENIKEFDHSLAGSRGANFGEMTFLTDSPDVASGYSAARQSKNESVMSAIKIHKEARERYFDAIVERGQDSNEAKALEGAYESTAELVSKASGDGDNYRTVTEGANVIPAAVRGNFLDYDADGSNWRKANKNAIEQAKLGGYDGVRIKNVVDSATTNTQKPSNVMAVFDPKNIRSVNAAFDPAKKESSNLLAGLGAGVVAGGAALAPQDASAQARDLPALLAMRGEKYRPDTIQGARPLGALGSVADLIESADRNIDGPANMIVPTGTAEYIRKLQYGDDIGYLDRLFANPLLQIKLIYIC